ncbi:MAG: right-handed parallel beta-helix repeat-containing protein [Nitriliruptorales bacterium]|nr:right-handed parallel beta-helix repeat-containing protein [Nitriliruptorales bacterium]
MRKLWVLLAAGIAALLLAGCGGDDADEGGGEFVNIGMIDNHFTRDVTRIPVGGQVRFVNQGDDVHNAVDVDGAWSTIEAAGIELMPPGDSVTMTFDEPGVYDFYCTIHGTEDGRGMAATLIVGDAEGYEATGVEPPAEPVREWTGVTRRAGGEGEFDTIQAAVDAAEPGDLVLVAPGVYHEEVTVTTPYLTIRGEDRNETVIDGQFELRNGINVVEADGVAVENLTVRNVTINGVFWTGVRGYRASYVTAHNNGVYGIYAFDATDGLFEHSYASGSPDAGFYIGQCDPCEALITDVVAEWNGLGYSGTNASGYAIANSIWRHNSAGIVPNSLDSELLPPAKDVTIVGNLVHDNSNADAPALEFQSVGRGVGIVLGGVLDSTIERNRIVNHESAGVAVAPLPDKRIWLSGGNVVRDNVVEGSGVADLLLAGPSTGGDRFCGNDAWRTVPPGLETFSGCGGVRLPLRFDLNGTMNLLGRFAAESGVDHPVHPYEDAPLPPAQPQLPGGADAEVRPAVDVFASTGFDASSVELPEPPDDLSVTQRKEPTVSGVPVLASAWSVFFGVYGYLLPLMLLAAWTALALWDIARRDDLSRGAAIGWVAAVLIVPFVGVIAYHAVSGSPIPGWLRASYLVGGLVAYLVILGIGAVVGGVV